MTGPPRRRHVKDFRAVAKRFGKRVHLFQGTVTVAAVRLWARGWIQPQRVDGLRAEVGIEPFDEYVATFSMA